MRKTIIMDYLTWLTANGKQQSEETVNEYIRATTGHDCEACGLRAWAKEYLAIFQLPDTMTGEEVKP
jgi:hypothetical protein